MSLKDKKKIIASLENSERWIQIDEDGNLIGEPKEVNVIMKGISRQGFAITYLAEVIRLIDTIGNKKMKVVKYILSKMDATNKLVETTEEISKNCGVSKMTVVQTLQMLEEVGFVARKTGVVMLSPKIAHKGNAKRERFLMTKFHEINSANSKEIDSDDEN